MPASLVPLGLLSFVAPVLAPLLVMSSPWWENYDLRESYLCSDRAAIVLERNDSQASLITGRYRSTLFREASEGPALRYSNGSLRVILRGDELTLEQLPQKLTCIRTEDV
jgi:hypothetical protein